jgi:hypothetical protein
MAAATKKKPGQSLASLMKSLRALLPGDVKRLEGLEYLVEGKVKIELTYYCNYVNGIRESQEEKIKTCNPHSVKVYPYPKYFVDTLSYHVNISGVFRSRSFNKRADGSINIESVAVAVTQCLEAIDTYVAIKQAERHRDELIAKAIDVEVKAVHKALKGVKLSNRTRYRRGITGIDSDNDRVSIRFEEPDKEEPVDHIEFYVDFSHLSKTQLQKLIPMIHEVACEPKE